MPNNDNNNQVNFNNEVPVSGVQPNTPPQPIIEIPQTYYEKLEKEKEEEAAKNAPVQPVPQPTEENSVTSKIIPTSLINAIVIFGIFYATVNINVLVSAATIIYITIGSIIFAIKDKKKSQFPSSVIVGGMIAAVVCFIVSMLLEGGMDLWTYYASACAITGIVGLMVSSNITKLLTDIKNIKALQTIGYLLFFAILIAGPYFAYKKWPTEFYQIVFYQQNEVIAETYEEYVLKTLKARYNIPFTCNFAEKENHKTEKNEIMTTLTCNDPNGNAINVRTIAYNETENQYTIIEDFIETIYLKEIKESISTKVKEATGATNVVTYLYPKQGCMFVGDCADCEDYYKVYSKVNDPKNRYEISSSLNLSKYLNLSNEEFISKYINQNEYKVLLHIKGNYNKDITDFTIPVNQALTALNQTGLKNNYGYEITFYEVQTGAYESKEHTEIGKTNDTKEFK